MGTVKICGLTRKSDVRLCAELGADIAGFVVEYPLDVPWNLSMTEAAPLLAAAAPMKRCIVTGGSRGKIVELAAALRPDYVQLHFQESLADTESIADALQPLGIGVIKTLPLLPRQRQAQFGTAALDECVRRLNAAAIHAVLVDSRAPANAAEKGGLVDCALFTRVRRLSSKPVILAGGITPDNITAVMAEAAPEHIDVMTGVETLPGIKSGEAVRKLLQGFRRNR